MYQLNTTIKNEFKRPFRDQSETSITIADIGTLSQIFAFVERRFIPSIFLVQMYPNQENTDINEDHMFSNFLMGAVRIRQLRLRDNTCVIWKIIKHHRSFCIGPYSEENIDKEPFGPQNSNAWKYHSPEDVGYPYPKNLKLTTYQGGGYLIDLPKDYNESMYIIRALKHNLWLDRKTCVVFFEFALYNTNVNLFSFVSIAFETPSSGSILPNMSINSRNLINQSQSVGLIICLVIFFFLNCIYVIRCLREMAYFKWRYLKMFWNHLDMTIAGLSTYSSYLDAQTRFYLIPEKLRTLKKYPEIFSNLNECAVLTQYHQQVFAVAVFFVYLRTFQYMNFNSTMDQLNRIMKKSAFNVLMFVIVFSILFTAFAASGFLFWGDASPLFSELGGGMFALVRLMFSKLDYDEIIRQCSIVGVLATMFYVVGFIFILLNVFLAIMNCSYAEVRTELGTRASELQITDYISIQLRTLLRAIGIRVKHRPRKKKNLMHAEEAFIRQKLLECGFTRLEIEMFFARYNIDPTAEVGDSTTEELCEAMGRGEDDAISDHFTGKHGVRIEKQDFDRAGQKVIELKYVLQILHETMNELIKRIEKATREAMNY